MRYIVEVDGQYYHKTDYGLEPCINNIPRRNRGYVAKPILSKTNQELAEYFGIPIRTYYHYKKQKLFDPTDIDSIYLFKQSIQTKRNK